MACLCNLADIDRWLYYTPLTDIQGNAVNAFEWAIIIDWG